MEMGYIGGSSKCEIYLYPSQTWGDGNRRTIKVRFEAKLKGGSGSYFGYPVDYRIWVNGTASDWSVLKRGEAWRGSDKRRAFEQSLTVDVGSSKAVAITVGVELRSGGSSWNGKYTENFWVERTNVPPSQPGWIRVKANNDRGAILSGIINENINTFFIDWGASSDGDGDVVYYDLQEQRNNGEWSSIDSSGTDTAHQFPVTGGEGTIYHYCVNARDNKGGTSEWTYSGAIVKNTFTMATLNSDSSIVYHGEPMTFTYSGGSNTQNGIGISYSMSCREISLYNGENFNSGNQVTINWGQRGGTSGAYINWEDIVNYFRLSDGKGALTFVLTGINSNGTVKTSEVTIRVNIQTKPDDVSGAVISTDSSESTAYRILASNGKGYFIPDETERSVRVKWNPVLGKYGDNITYKVFVAYKDGGWEELASGLTQTHFDHITAKPSVATPFKYLIRAISSGNGELYSEGQTQTETAHYYYPPSLNIENVDRRANSAIVDFRIYIDTSLEEISVIGRWTSGEASGMLERSTNQKLELTGLRDESTYSLKIYYNDDSGLSLEEKIYYIPIGASKPIFFVNKYGVGIGGYKANEEAQLNVSGAIASDKMCFRSVFDKNCNDVHSDELVITRHVSANRPEDYCLVRGLGQDQTFGLQIASYYGNADRFYLRGTFDTGYRWGEWAKIYTNRDKPTADDVGALAVTNGTIRYGQFGQNAGILETGHDFNEYLTEGEYGVAGENHKNAPIKNVSHLYGKLIVKVNDGGTHNNKSNWIWQTFISTEWDGIFMRRKVNGSDWTSWKVAQMTEAPAAYSTLESIEEKEERITILEREVAELKEVVKKLIEENGSN